MSGQSESATDLPLSPEEIIDDYRQAYRSRQASLIGRREVMSGKAKFGIFGDGKEIAQIALTKVIQKGDFRSGYYRDQTFMFATGETTIQSFFAQLYAHADLEADPATAGRSMNAHFATRSLDCNGQWKDLTAQFNSSADVSPTGAQMPRLVGLAYASRLYRELEELKAFPQFSHNGDEIAFGMVGNASCAEGVFWEAINAIGVLHAPALEAVPTEDDTRTGTFIVLHPSRTAGLIGGGAWFLGGAEVGVGGGKGRVPVRAGTGPTTQADGRHAKTPAMHPTPGPRPRLGGSPPQLREILARISLAAPGDLSKRQGRGAVRQVVGQPPKEPQRR